MLDGACDDQISVFSRSMALMVQAPPPVAAAAAAKEAKSSSSLHIQQQQQDSGKYVRYTAEQVQALERLYNECPKPSSLRRQQLIRECPILQNIEPKQIKVWFQNRRCREKQRKESTRLQTVNAKLTAMNKLLMEENDRLQKQVAHLLYENNYLRQQLHHGGITTDTSCDSVVTSGLQHLATPNNQSPQDATYSGILSLAEEAVTEFHGKATGTAVDWIQMPGMKPGPDSVMVHISHGCAGVAARACGLVGLEPVKVVEIFKDRPSWLRDCRRSTPMFATNTANGGTIEVLYTQMYAPTTLAPARDFCTLRLTSPVDDGGYLVCERSINGTHGAPMAPQMQSFVRGEMHSSGCLIKPCEGGGSVVIIVDHLDLEPWTVPEVLRPLYESSAVLAHKTTIAAFRHLTHVALEAVAEAPGAGQQPAAVRSLSHRLAKGFNDAVNGFADDGWTTIVSDGSMDQDVTIMVRSAPSCTSNRDQLNAVRCSPVANNNVLCAKASMLLQNVPPSLLVRFLREHRSEWADSSCEEEMRLGNLGFSGFHGTASCNAQVLQPQIHALERDEFLELIKMESRAEEPGRLLGGTRDMFLLQLCSGTEENGGAGASAQMVFAPIDASMSDDITLVPSGFRVIPLDSGSLEAGNNNASARTLDLASTLEIGPGSTTSASSAVSNSNLIATRSSNSNGDSNHHHQHHHHQHLRSVLTIAFQFSYDARAGSQMQEAVASMARQYVRNVVSTVQRVAMALAPPPLPPPPPPVPSSRINNNNNNHHSSSNSSHQQLLSPPHKHNSTGHVIPEALLLARWLCRSYKLNLGLDLAPVDSDSSEECLKALWKLEDALICCSCKSQPTFTFANQAGLDMLETTSMGLQELSWEKALLDADGSRKGLTTAMSQVMQQGYACLPAGVRLSSMGRAASYDRAIAWKVQVEEDDNNIHGVAFLFVNWSFVVADPLHHALLL